MFKGEDKTTINSSKDKVWEVVTSFSNYFKWNSVINKAHGTLEEGKRLELVCLSQDGSKTTYDVKVEKLREGKELVLKTTDLGMGFRYYIKVNEVGENEVEITQGKEFYGILKFMKKSHIEKEIKKLKIMNKELKGYVLMLE